MIICLGSQIAQRMVLASVSCRGGGGGLEDNVIPDPASTLQEQSSLFIMLQVNSSWQVTSQVFQICSASY